MASQKRNTYNKRKSKKNNNKKSNRKKVLRGGARALTQSEEDHKSNLIQHFVTLDFDTKRILKKYLLLKYPQGLDEQERVILCKILNEIDKPSYPPPQIPSIPPRPEQGDLLLEE